MIPIVARAGHRVIAPDLIGFGRSDKPRAIETHTYAFHVAAIAKFIETLDLRNVTLVCQDWDSLIGLRVAAENERRFARIVLANGGLPTGEPQTAPRPAFLAWKANVDRMRAAGDMPVAAMMAAQAGADVGAAYGAPFPDASYKAGPLAMPALVPLKETDPGAVENKRLVITNAGPSPPDCIQRRRLITREGGCFRNDSGAKSAAHRNQEARVTFCRKRTAEVGRSLSQVHRRHTLIQNSVAPRTGGHFCRSANALRQRAELSEPRSTAARHYISADSGFTRTAAKHWWRGDDVDQLSSG
jgi:pimeloyl-ACP methyl ester carboxylesterase